LHWIFSVSLKIVSEK